MKKYLFFIIIILSIAFIDCRQTKRFKNIEVQGRLVHFYTKQPMPNVTIRLKANDVHSASSYAEASILLDTYTTDADGTFILKSKASKKDNYYLQIDTENHIYSYTATDTFFNSPPNKIVNIGNLYFGEHTFWYKVRLISTSGNCAWVFDQNQQFIKINSGLDTTILYNTLQTYYSLREYKNNIYYNIKTGPCSNSISAVPSHFDFPITFVDTMSFQKNF